MHTIENHFTLVSRKRITHKKQKKLGPQTNREETNGKLASQLERKRRERMHTPAHAERKKRFETSSTYLLDGMFTVLKLLHSPPFLLLEIEEFL